MIPLALDDIRVLDISQGIGEVYPQLLGYAEEDLVQLRERGVM